LRRLRGAIQTMGTIKALVGFLAIIAVVVCIFQIAPPLMANYSFQDDLKTEAMVAGANISRTDDEIRNDILRKAKEHDLPIEAKQVSVQHISTPGIAAVYVEADYTVPVNLPGYSFEMHFNPNSGNK
jgi:hypothetical protein